jgi:hypothetical protein
MLQVLVANTVTQIKGNIQRIQEEIVHEGT